MIYFGKKVMKLDIYIEGTWGLRVTLFFACMTRFCHLQRMYVEK